MEDWSCLINLEHLLPVTPPVQHTDTHTATDGEPTVEIPTLQELRLRLDAVPCQPRLYPTRLYALQLHARKPIAAWINEGIVQPLWAGTPDPIGGGGQLPVHPGVPGDEPDDRRP